MNIFHILCKIDLFDLYIIVSIYFVCILPLKFILLHLLGFLQSGDIRTYVWRKDNKYFLSNDLYLLVPG